MFLNYTGLRAAKGRNIGRIEYLFEIGKTKFTRYPTNKMAVAIMLMAVYLIGSLFVLGRLGVTKPIKLIYYALICAVLGLWLSITYTDPGFLSHPIKFFIKDPTCDACFTSKEETCHHCPVADMCVKDYKYYSSFLGTCVTSRNQSNVSLLFGLMSVHAVFAFYYWIKLVS